MAISKALLWIILIASLVRLGLFVVVYQMGEPKYFWLGDTQGYMQIAENLLAGHGYSMATSSPYLPDSIRTPILPFVFAGVLALFGSPLPYILVQIALAAWLVYIAYRIAMHITGREGLSLFAAALMAFEPYSIFVNLSLLTETLFAAVLMTGVYAALRYAQSGALVPLALASALFAFAALTRPIAQFLPVLLIALVLYRGMPRVYLKYLCAAIIPFILIASPWLFRNHTEFGRAAFSSGGFQNVYSDLGATIISYRDGIDWRSAKVALEADFAMRHGIDVSTIQQDLSQSMTLFQEGLSLIVSNPIPAIKSLAALSIAFFTNDAWVYYLDHWDIIEPFEYGFSPTQSLLSEGPVVTAQRALAAAGPWIVVPITGRLFWVGVTVALFLGLWLLYREGGKARTAAFVFLFTILYFLGLSWSAGAGVNGRYRYPLDPIIFTAACIGAAYVIERIRSMMRASV